MQVSSSFRSFLKLDILHSYFLNDGEKDFSSMNEEESKTQLKSYNWKDFLEIYPSQKTSHMMRGNKIFFKSFNDSIILAIKVESGTENQPFNELYEDESMTFLLSLKDQYFGNYTDLDLADQLLYFSNKTPVLPEAFTFKPIDRINQSGTVGEEYLYEGENKKHLLEEAHLNPGGGVLGIIQIYMKGDTPVLSLINNDGTLKNSLPHFKIHFSNRKSTWKYINLKDDFETETKKDYPLTKFGFILLDKKSDFISPPAHFEKYVFPNPDARRIKITPTKNYSEIFI
ncbi:hypothetical protein [Algoriphagus machipongonensis]|uniref:Uncharacterized protein n=1 Tax=Algoriphagus machipongonensis TaxID=388413 RepID=A3HTC3_9BACT|nr:hypothetical protein [Algoriphagus machipongonensis]7ADZ_1A Chain 1A, cap adaptor protein (Algo2) [Algoriphagus machipongonensis]7ADZ_1B Chain 1B, cap adaptor protein (Algo2) [Algoriphagus machipongonensis]7ADZ_1C Chain 1C, cap adaptor protein (Algo2) [Algoriphagus machipongonensis]7ADZ_1D Chain 1D, cap adaptor protein (Algo2) [Algoriphagus machipongonensis]7ADZ_1E Chain 1E, cap adaptor protein (Algo2) [Algoriphagus machipongonensis]7ADZ_1F Chain 1F, cap adaptor protein (Algo2) [Algoriphag